MHNYYELERVLYTPSNQVEEIYSALQNYFGEAFTFIRQFQDGSFITLSSQPNWSLMFLNKLLRSEYSLTEVLSHVNVSNNIINKKTESHYYSLWCANPDDPFFREAQNYFSYKQGITLIDIEDEWTDLYYLYTTNDSLLINNTYLNNIDTLENFKEYFLSSAEPLIKNALKKKLILPDKYRDLTSTPSVDESQLISTINNSLSTSNNQAFKLLTSSELLCIKGAASGMTAKEFAKKICRSSRTVESHIASAKKKFGVKKTSELIAKIYCSKSIT